MTIYKPMLNEEDEFLICTLHLSLIARLMELYSADEEEFEKAAKFRDYGKIFESIFECFDAGELIEVTCAHERLAKDLLLSAAKTFDDVVGVKFINKKQGEVQFTLLPQIDSPLKLDWLLERPEIEELRSHGALR